MPFDPDILIAFGSLLVAAIALVASSLRNWSSGEREEQMVSDRLSGIAESVARLTSIVEAMDAKLDMHADSIARNEERTNGIITRLSSLEQRVSEIERRQLPTSSRQSRHDC